MAGATKLAGEGLLAGRYALTGELGRGASGRVLSAVDRAAHDAPRALKLVAAADAARLGWELSALSRVEHPNLARVYELVRVDRASASVDLPEGSPVLVTELASGRTSDVLAAELRRDRGALLKLVLCVADGVSRALSALHGSGLIHGDVKPSNIVVSDRLDQCKLIDLGLARERDSASPGLFGTPAYMAPELFRGERTPGVDVYALGVSLYELLLGAPESESKSGSPAEQLRWALRPPAARAALPESTPPALRRLIDSMLEPDPDQRLRPASEIRARVAPIAEAFGLGREADVGGGADAAPSAREQATAIAALPFVGQAPALDALSAAMSSGERVLIVRGAHGAGRSRLVREAVRRLQLARLSADAAVPSYFRLAQLPQPALAVDAVIHVDDADSLGAERVSAFARAFALEAHESWLVLERSAPLALEGAVEVVVQPLAEGELRRLLEHALPGTRVTASHLREALVASAALAGRLCRVIAHAIASGADLHRAQSLRISSAELESGGDTELLSESARELFELLTVAGGELDARAAGAALGHAGELSSAYQELLAAGLAALVDARLCARTDAIEAERARLAPERWLELAARLPSDELDGRARAHVLLARGDRRGAYVEFGNEIGRLRALGRPEHAEACARDAIAALAELDDDASLRCQLADALRAQGRYREAREVLANAAENASVLALAAELARLSGDASGAEALATRARALERAESNASALAETILARLHYDRGELEAAQRGAEEAAARIDPSSAAGLRAEEVLGLVRLHRGELEQASRGLHAAIERAASARLREPEARLTALLGQLERERGDPHAAARDYAAAFELADGAGEQHAAAAFLHNVGVQRLDCGEPGPAIAALRDAARRLARLGRDADLGRVLYNLGHAAQLIGQDDLALGSSERAYEAATRALDRTTQAFATCLSAELRVKLGERRVASQLLARPLELTFLGDAARASVCARICCLQLLLGERQRAESAYALAESAALGAQSEDAELELALARCQLELERGRAEQAKLAAERGYALSQRGGSFEARLRATLSAARAARACADAGLAALRFSEVRSMLDHAARGLSPSERAQLRAVDAYRAALEASPSQVANAALVPGHDERWRLLAGLAKRLTAERREPRLHEIVLDAALELTSAERGYVVLRDRDGEPRVRAVRGLERRRAESDEPSFSRSIVARVLGAGEPLRTMDAASDVELSGAASVHALSLRSVLAVPLRLRGEVLGAIYLEDRLRPFAFGELELALLRDLCELASIALESSRLLRAERRDARRLRVLRARLARRVEAQAVELEALKSVQAGDPSESYGLVGHSPAMQRVTATIAKLAAASVPVLILGESGTGKELVARAIHDASGRKGATFVSENCGAIPEALLESALFGHVRGAFTGADRRRLGLFEVADGGTLFLDEIGEMTPAMQARLLRVLQDGEVRPLGGERVRKVDVRVLCATHRDLPAMVAEGRFREDLYYRIAVMTLHVPALRERAEDIPALVAHFIQKYGGGGRYELEKRSLLALASYAWPGNVRQLENEIRRALVLSDGVIAPEHLSAVLTESGSAKAAEPLDLRAQVDQLERKLIRQALDAAAGNQTQAARILGLSRYGLQKMIRRLEREGLN